MANCGTSVLRNVMLGMKRRNLDILPQESGSPLVPNSQAVFDGRRAILNRERTVEQGIFLAIPIRPLQ